MPKYEQPAVRVEAHQIQHDITVHHQGLTVEFKAGCWSVTYEDGHQMYMHDDTFRARFRPIEYPAAKIPTQHMNPTATCAKCKGTIHTTGFAKSGLLGLEHSPECPR